jgi:hypothetical protein
MTESRKIRESLTKEKRERLENFKSIWRPDMRVEPFLPSKELH